MLEKIKNMDTTFTDKILLYLLNIKELDFPYITYLESKCDVIHYILFQKEIRFIQVIIQKQEWNQKKNFDILQKALKKRKIAKNYLTQIDKIIQFNLILFKNNESFIKKEWDFIDEKFSFPKSFYKIQIINLYYLNCDQEQKKEYNSLFNLYSLFKNL